MVQYYVGSVSQFRNNFLLTKNIITALFLRGYRKEMAKFSFAEGGKREEIKKRVFCFH